LAIIEQLEGFEAPAGHWERYILPARLESYDPTWLDALTFFGRAAWGRLRPLSINGGKGNGQIAQGRPMKALTRSTPIALMLRDHVPWLLSVAEENADVAADRRLGGNARAAYEAFLQHGALFPAQLGSLLQLMPSQVEDALGELAAAGLVTSDGYPALRTLLGVKARRGRRGRRRPAPLPPHDSAALPASSGTHGSSAGRWTLVRSGLTPPVAAEERTEQWCRLLVRRYGVMFRDLLAGESAAPSWHELVRTYRRLEARGELRGGRFVAGVAGEQYAMAEVIPVLRSAVDDPEEKPLIMPATDPLNFTGRIGSAARVPALPGQSIVIVHGAVQAREAAVRDSLAVAGTLRGP
jgi:ATP-dependent Lhr-like helicase